MPQTHKRTAESEMASQAENAATDGLKDVTAGAHALADKLTEDES